MNVIVNIGYNLYLVQSKKEAAAIVCALAGAIRLDRKYVGKKEYFYPADRQCEVGMQTILPDQMVRSEPPDESEADESAIPQGFPAPPKQLSFKKGGGQ